MEPQDHAWEVHDRQSGEWVAGLVEKAMAGTVYGGGR
jgi:hypothetical protein